MQVIITGRVADSAGALESGRIEFAQAQRIDTGALLVTSSLAVAQVVNGELRTLGGEAFTLPSNTEGTAVRVREIFGGQTFEWWTAVPDAASVEYRELPVVESDSVPASVWGPPPWLARVEQLRDETVLAIEEGAAVAEALGGLAGIQEMLSEATVSAENAQASASLAEGAAEAASSSAAAATAAAGASEAAATNAGANSASAAASKRDAEAAKGGADAAKSAAESAETSARASAEAAVSSATASGAAQEKSETAKAAAEAAANQAKAEADRAKEAADSVDMEAIDLRLDQMDVSIADKTSKEYVDDAVAGVAVGQSDIVSSVRYPLTIAHRGGPLVSPEHSMEAYVRAFESGFTPEADVRALSDGTLVCVHDVTTNRTMSVSRPVASMTRKEWEAAHILPPKNGGRFSGTGIGTPVYFTDYLDRFGGRIVLTPELKTTAAADVAAFIKAIKDRGLQKSVITQSFDFATAKKFADAGLHALVLSDSTAAATIAAAGIRFVGVSLSATAAYISQCKAAGLKVFGYTALTKAQHDTLVRNGCDGVFSNDPWETSREFKRVGAIDLSDGLLPIAANFNWGNSGGQVGATQRAEVANNALNFITEEKSSVGAMVKLGAFGSDLVSARLRFWVRSDAPKQTSAPENAWLFGVYMGTQTGDVAVNEQSGQAQFRLAMVRRSGEQNVYERSTPSATTTKVGTASAAAYAPAGGRSGDLQFEVAFTATTVSITCLSRNDGTLTATTSTWAAKPSYLTISVLGAVGAIWGISCSVL